MIINYPSALLKPANTGYLNARNCKNYRALERGDVTELEKSLQLATAFTPALPDTGSRTIAPALIINRRTAGTGQSTPPLSTHC